MRKFIRRHKIAVVVTGAVALLGVYPGSSTGSTELSEQDMYAAMQDAQSRVDAINNMDDVPDVVQNLIPGAMERRNVAMAQYEANQDADPLSKPEYAVIWAGKNNAGDFNGNYAMRFLDQGAINPQGLVDVGTLQFAPGLDAMVVVDVRKLNADGSRNIDYGKVVNFVQVPPPFGIEGEPHHMQYEWSTPGQPIIAGHLFTDVTSIWDVSDIPNITLKNVVRPEENPAGSFPDAYDFTADGRAMGTYMGGPNVPPNYGGSPGSVVVFKPDSAKGLVQESETPASQFGAVLRGNPNGVPEPCTVEEARPAGTCGNPHGIQIRSDLGIMVSNDYADARELGSDPIKQVNEHNLRPTSRIWDISDPGHPELISVAHMPKSPKKPANEAHDNLGIMEGAKTRAPSKGIFSGSMCGGGIFFLPDMTNVQPDSSDQWRQVFDDGMALAGLNGDRDILGAGAQDYEPGACAGGAWHQVSHDNRFLFRTVGGRNPGSNNVFDNGFPKMIWVANIEKLIASAADGSVDCNIDTPLEIGLGRGDEADCPELASVLLVDDYTTGGPHWAALDNWQLTESGAPTRMIFCNYFVARTGYDGNRRCYMANVDPATGALSYDNDFRDENTGALGIDFNRRDWPGHANGGFYKPHSMVFVTPS
ncbi:MAG: hypothetical protein ACRDZ3_14165 [Acidimicrobiia bacterium]